MIDRNVSIPMTRLLRAFVVTTALFVGDSFFWVNAQTTTATDIEHVNRIARQVIAPCCWTQTVDAHHSPAAEKVKEEIRAGLAAGLSDEAIIDRLVEEYGERILAIPRAQGFNVMLWILLAVVIVVGSLVLIFYLRRLAGKNPASTSPPLPAVDGTIEERIKRELNDMVQ